MPENDINGPRGPETDISVNQYGNTRDPAVVVDEPDRTVLLTRDETVVFEKEPAMDIVPRDRPRSVYAGMWGRSEIAIVAVGIFALLTVAIVYVFLVVPSNNAVERHRTELDTLVAEQQNADRNFGDQKDTSTRVSDVISSEENFEASHLPPEASGRNALYQRLNGLIDAFGLTNTAGPDYAPLETIDQNAERSSGDDRGRDRFRSIFPGLYVTMTVEGSYQNLRRFIHEMESGREFVIISAVQLEPSETQRSQSSSPAEQPQVQNETPVQRPGIGGRFPAYPQQQSPVYVAPKGKTHGDVVSLHLEMAAYFRRPDFAPVADQ